MCWFSCKVTDKMETSTHTVFLGEVMDADVIKDGAPMTYAYYHKVLKGKTAPQGTHLSGGGEVGGEVCLQDLAAMCTAATFPLKNCPTAWVCPVCGAPKSQFEKK